LWSYRNEGAFARPLAAQIADDVIYAIKPKSLTVRVTQNVRGRDRIGCRGSALTGS